MNKYLTAFLLLPLLLSCNKHKPQINTKIEDLGDKYVLVYCMIHAQFPEWPESPTNPLGQKVSHSEYSREPDIQRLFLCYNTYSNGVPEKLESAVPKLFDSKSGVQIGTFERVSDYEWQLSFSPEGILLDDNHKDYSCEYRLEISGIPGQGIITASSSFDKTIPSRYFGVSQNGFHVFTVDETHDNAWLVLNTYKQTIDNIVSEPTAGGPLMPILETKRVSPPKFLWTNYPNCDSFNYDKTKDRYTLAIRIIKDQKKDNNSGLYSLLLEPFEDDLFLSGTIYTSIQTEATINYVSDDIDSFLKSGISYYMKNDFNSIEGLPDIFPNPLISSNIKGGLGIFGIQVISFFNDKWGKNGSL